MKSLPLLAVALAAGIMAAPSVAKAQAFVHTSQSTQVFSGPSYSYPAVAYLPYGTRLYLHGCLSDYAWCDVSYQGVRGWAHADALPRVYGAYPTISFIFGSYWDNHYRNRPWYSSRARFQNWDWRNDSRRWEPRHRDQRDFRDQGGRRDWRDNDRRDGRRDGRGSARPDVRDRDRDARQDRPRRENDRPRDRRFDGVPPATREPLRVDNRNRIIRPTGNVSPPTVRPNSTPLNNRSNNRTRDVEPRSRTRAEDVRLKRERQVEP